jgi:hypothetical protein
MFWGFVAYWALLLTGCHKFQSTKPVTGYRVHLRSAESLVFPTPLQFRIKPEYDVIYLQDAENWDEIHFQVTRLPATIDIDLSPLLDIHAKGFFVQQVNQTGPLQYYGINTSTFNDKSQSLDFLIVESLGGGYARTGPDIYYAETKMEGCDRQTFQVLSLDPPIGRDANRVYVYSGRIEGADAATYEHLGQGYGRDARSVFYQQKKLPVSDPKKFMVLPVSEWGKDDISVFYSGVMLKDAQPASFVTLSSAYAKDDQGVYFAEKRLEANPATFRAAGATTPYYNLYALDGNLAFYLGYKLELARPEALRTFDQDIQGRSVYPRYATDGVTLLFEGNPVPNVDLATFKITIQIGDYAIFARDRDNCYIGNTVETIANCDAHLKTINASFESGVGVKGSYRRQGEEPIAEY